jgi:hypothetical protein
MLDSEGDNAKAAANFRKHGVIFEQRLEGLEVPPDIFEEMKRAARGELGIEEGIRNPVMKYGAAMSTEAQHPEDFVSLYRRAFEEYGASALWSSRPVPNPTCDDALAITRSLRVEGDLNARRLAEKIEKACRAAI